MNIAFFVEPFWLRIVPVSCVALVFSWQLSKIITTGNGPLGMYGWAKADRFRPELPSWRSECTGISKSCCAQSESCPYYPGSPSLAHPQQTVRALADVKLPGSCHQRDRIWGNTSKSKHALESKCGKGNSIGQLCVYVYICVYVCVCVCICNTCTHPQKDKTVIAYTILVQWWW